MFFLRRSFAEAPLDGLLWPLRFVLTDTMSPPELQGLDPRQKYLIESLIAPPGISESHVVFIFRLDDFKKTCFLVWW